MYILNYMWYNNQQVGDEMDLIINDENLQINEIQEFCSKARALLIDDKNQILVANYGGVLLLPGGSIDKDETISHALIRELDEEIGQKYTEDELSYLACLNYFQANYPKRNGTFQNRLVQTHYFVGNFKGVSNEFQTLTAKEIKDNFQLELVSLDKLKKIILENENNNPRNIYFQNELLTILKFWNDNFNSIEQNDSKVKKLEKK